MDVAITNPRRPRTVPASPDRRIARSMAVRGAIAASALLGTLMGIPQAATAAEIEPFEYVTLPAGTSVQIIYLDYGDYDSYRNINVEDGAPQDADLDTYTAISKTAHYFDLADHRALVSVIQTVGASRNASINGENLGETDGFGDTTLGFVFWPIADDAGGTNLGLAHYLTVPTGSYSRRRSVNLGGNRFVSNFQASLHQPLGGKWSTDLAADIIFYTPNSDFGAASQRLTQKPAQQFQAFVNYSFDPTLTAGVGYQGWRGGAQKLDGVRTGAKAHYDEVRFSVAKLISPKLQVLGEFSHQTHVEGGFRQDANALVRIAYFF